MKISISIPDPVFQTAERIAKRLHISRSQLYSEAVSAYVHRHSEESITATLDEIYKDEHSALDRVIEKLQFASLPAEDWE
jgi:metal-responsive CopG/Arc/MetJ family transcriptional regulator